jgi:DNA invertase Pin-like site-specific DNA recombinase
MTEPLHLSVRSSKFKPWHFERTAIVYVRQSTPQQVIDHQESTARQYGLVDRAVALGWPRAQVVVIDDDLGKSGRTVEGRLGFQRLLADVSLDRIGIVFGLEMSRLARSCKDWHHLLELCGRFRTLLADADGIYDPTDYNDRLLLGLTGIMSEAELHVIKQRMHQGRLNKARRGDLIGPAPIGYLKRSKSELALDPDEQVQAVVRLIFDQFDRQGTLHGLLRYLVHHQIRLPVRPHGGPDQGQLQWRRPCRETLQNLLHHPIYAGAYRYGHRPCDARRKQPGRPGTGRRICGSEDCLVLIRDRFPAYISWERFQANQQRMQANRTQHEACGAPREGAALLKGLLHCGRCGRRMQVHYAVHRARPTNRYTYVCSRAVADYAEPLCQSLTGMGLDELAARHVLAAVEPAALEASMAAVADVERERAELQQHWRLRLERAQYDVERASRQYQACEPENRLVARELERRWEETLEQQRNLDDEFQRWRQAEPARLSPDEQALIRRLAADMPTLWRAETTTIQDRVRIARLLLEKVVVTVDRASERVAVRFHWVGGATQDQTLARPVKCYTQMADYPKLVATLRALHEERLDARRIADRLNAERFRPPKRATRFTAAMVRRLLERLELQGRPRLGSRIGLKPDEWRPGELARHLGIPRDTIIKWRNKGWLHSERDADGYWILWADADETVRLRELHALPRTWANKPRFRKLIKPKRRPKR